jgi:hypothetical protein
VFGELDKGTGIEVPQDALERPSHLPPLAELPRGVTVAEAAPSQDVRSTGRAPVESLWRRVQRWRGMRPRPRPSGT